MADRTASNVLALMPLWSRAEEGLRPNGCTAEVLSVTNADAAASLELEVVKGIITIPFDYCTYQVVLR